MIGSLAVISDAVHNFFDIGSMVLALLGEKIGSRKNDLKKTYGYKRAEILVAFINSLILFLSVAVIGFESMKRLFHPQPVNGGWMLIIGSIAFAGNIIATKFLHKDSNHNLNLKAVFLHSLQDALFSAGVMIGAIFVLIFHTPFVDPLISIILSVFLLKEAFGLIKSAVDILMEAVPAGIDVIKLKEQLLKIKGVSSVNDLHVWQTGSDDMMITAHVTAKMLSEEDYALILKQIQTIARSGYNIEHSTIQLVPFDIQNQLADDCTHCN